MAFLGKKSPQQPALDAPVPLWQNRSYVLLVSGQAISQVGSEVSELE